ncbi:MAG: pyridoxamine 5'-phosphate oxidase family protein [Bacillota bacterium]|jgi:nitroimidazol reductase NimA-like FMN-containing flavoprotein (pyridoxamine 5'-phosphate oxidase superfamily)
MSVTYKSEENMQKAYQLFRDCEYGVLATIDSSDGYPYGTPVSLVVIDNDIYFHSAKVGQKNTNMEQNPKVCVTCVGETELKPECYNTDFESAIACGQAQEVKDEQEKIAVLRKICEKYAASNMQLFDTAIAEAFSRTAIYKVQVEKITSKVRKN